MLPTLFDITDILFFEARYINFLLKEDILYKQAICPYCHIPMIRLDKRWRCPKKSYQQSVSIFKDTLFSNCHIPYNKVLLVCHLWLAKTTSVTIQKLTGRSTATIAQLLGLFRQLVASSLDKQTSGENHMIGGEGIIVEIGESKFYNPHTDNLHINAQVGCVFSGVERTAERHVFIEHIENQSANTLLVIIHHRVHPGSIILSDC